MEDKKRLILIEDSCAPEDNAMLQALYSRSSASVTEHLEKVKKAGSGKFMEQFYVGYGHGSIGDCGSTTIFVESVSILAAKAIQDWRLYSGQETSTRYIDMAKQPIIDPINSAESKEIINSWMEFYIGSQEKVKEHLRLTHPRREEEDEKVYERAVNARVFDILRSFLPSGIATQLSWHTNLRQAADRLALLNHHPLQEIKEISKEILRQLKEKYPSSFSHKLYEGQEAYRESISKDYTYYFNPESPTFDFSTNIKAESLAPFKEVISERPIKTNLPSFLDELGGCWCDYLLDFGSSRDAQRHRNGVFRMPLATTHFGFHAWYLEQLPEDLRTQARELIKTQTERIAKLNVSEEEKQYYVSLGFLVSCRTYYSLPQMIYVTELRADTTVHPTYRLIAHQMHHALAKNFPDLKLHSNLSASDWDIRRGEQDIIKK
ncbi:MAG: FAD-dependent thymidylate synthase [Candidatus Falkowbacteria bacterium]|nr:FAD-dependent thymidylate synthase [Candidatus Falkowbacteria bacterium]